MENKEILFKTNLNCGGCVAKVQNDLDNTIGENKWQVDTDHPDKTLSIKCNIDPEKVIEIIKSKGFNIEEIK